MKKKTYLGYHIPKIWQILNHFARLFHQLFLKSDLLPTVVFVDYMNILIATEEDIYVENSERAQSESWLAGNTFSSTMLFRAILFIGLVSSSIEAVRPVVSNNEWTPVTNSQRVYLSPEVLARYRQQEAQDR